MKLQSFEGQCHWFVAYCHHPVNKFEVKFLEYIGILGIFICRKFVRKQMRKNTQKIPNNG